VLGHASQATSATALGTPTEEAAVADQASDVLDLATARDLLLHPGGRARSLLALAADVVIAELDCRRAAIERVRDLHFATEPGEWICEECSQDWPCPTSKALKGEEVARG
jgi:hypothetical protein